MNSHSENIKKPLAIVWEHYLYKVEHPEYFVPGVSNVVIREKTSEFVIRAMDLTLPDGKMTSVVEKISHQPYWVRYSIVEHPFFTGYVDNFAEAISADETKITYSLNWVNKKDGIVVDNPELIKNAVIKTKEYILKAD